MKARDVLTPYFYDKKNMSVCVAIGHDNDRFYYFDIGTAETYTEGLEEDMQVVPLQSIKVRFVLPDALGGDQERTLT
jgi:hypothetical protein